MEEVDEVEQRLNMFDDDFFYDSNAAVDDEIPAAFQAVGDEIAAGEAAEASRSAATKNTVAAGTISAVDAPAPPPGRAGGRAGG